MRAALVNTILFMSLGHRLPWIPTSGTFSHQFDGSKYNWNEWCPHILEFCIQRYITICRDFNVQKSHLCKKYCNVYTFHIEKCFNSNCESKLFHISLRHELPSTLSVNISEDYPIKPRAPTKTEAVFMCRILKNFTSF